MSHEQLHELYRQIKSEIEKKCDEFAAIRFRNEETELFRELVFCLLTPQSNAHRAWDAVCTLTDEDLLLHGSLAEIVPIVRAVRFHNNKSRYILNARSQLFGKLGQLLRESPNDHIRRERLVCAVKGFGMKEASHFLRNIGYYHECAILDRHIMRQLYENSVIAEVPVSLSFKKYIDIESAMTAFAHTIDIPLEHLDMLFWYAANGELFK